MDAKNVRKASYAGSFYPQDSEELSRAVRQHIDQAQISEVIGVPKILVCPHAGYVFSGDVAGYSYRVIQNAVSNKVAAKKIFLLGPSHQWSVRGLCLSDNHEWETALGRVNIDDSVRLMLESGGIFTVDRQAHDVEHSLEVQLPFLQIVYGKEPFSIIPIIMTDVDPVVASQTLDGYFDERSLVIVSSDLSHYKRYDRARVIDGETIRYILELDIEQLEKLGVACGMEPLLIAVRLARKHSWKPMLLKYLSSGDTAGQKDSVVGYAAICFYE